MTAIDVQYAKWEINKDTGRPHNVYHTVKWKVCCEGMLEACQNDDATIGKDGVSLGQGAGSAAFCPWCGKPVMDWVKPLNDFLEMQRCECGRMWEACEMMELMREDL